MWEISVVQMQDRVCSVSKERNQLTRKGLEDENVDCRIDNFLREKGI